MDFHLKDTVILEPRSSDGVVFVVCEEVASSYVGVVESEFLTDVGENDGAVEVVSDVLVCFFWASLQVLDRLYASSVGSPSAAEDVGNTELVQFVDYLEYRSW